MHISLTIQPGKFVLNAIGCASPATVITSENGALANVKTEGATLGSSLPYGLRDRSTARNDAFASLEQEGEAP